jgi:hypothetical protein
MLFTMQRKHSSNRLVFCILFFLFCSSAKSSEMQIMETNDTYVVTAVQAVGSAERQDEAADVSLKQARAIAYNHLAAALGLQKLDEVTIEGIVISYSPGGLQLHENGYYNALYDIVFSKRYLEEVLLKNQLDALYAGQHKSIKVQFEVSNVLTSWRIIKRKLAALKIDHTVSLITNRYIILLFYNCNQDTLQSKLSSVGISLIQNQDRYFGKLSFFAR